MFGVLGGSSQFHPFRELRDLFLMFHLLLILVLCCGCINKKTVLESGPGGVSPAELEREAILVFNNTPRSAESARKAFELMSSAARQSGSNDPQRFFRLHRAAWFGIWATHHGTGNWKSSLARELIILCNTAVEENPEEVEGYYYRAISIGLFAQENKLYGRDAMKEFRVDALKAIELDPKYDYGGPHRVLGALHLRAPGPPVGIGSTQRAYRQLQIAREIAPDYPENLLFLAEVCIKMNRQQESKSYLEQLAGVLDRYGSVNDRIDWKRRGDDLERILHEETK